MAQKFRKLFGPRNLYEFVAGAPVRYIDPLGLKLCPSDCGKFLKDALLGYDAQLAADYKAGLYEGILFTTGGLVIGATGGGAAIVGGVIVGGSGDILDVYGAGKQMDKAQEQLANAFKLYNRCVELTAEK